MADTPLHPARVRTRGSTLLVPVLLGLVALLYAAGHLAWYRTTPLGQVPVMDEQENVLLAESIVQGELPKEPFFRAMGYPLLLAALRLGGVESNGLFFAALVLGVLLHAGNAALVAGIARAWFGRTAAGTAGLLVALNPVLVHYATQSLDATTALTLFLAGLACLAPELKRPAIFPGAVWPWIGASLAWAAAAATRPNYLLAWALLPGLALCIQNTMTRMWTFLGASTGIIILAAVAAWQWEVSGVPGFLPWQGTYNLWAANQPGTHGRYFAQRVQLSSAESNLNPARAESFHLFQQETGVAPRDIQELNTYWRRRFVDHVTEHPGTFVTLLARKAYALLNDAEQYNNKTFAFHQARSPWLRWNPLGWGLLLGLGIVGGARLYLDQPLAAKFLLFLTLVIAASILLFYVSARFRLPLCALAAIMGGGALAQPSFWRSWPRRRQATLATAVLLAGALTFSRFDHVRDDTTWVEDHALLARAAYTVGDYPLAWQEARAALARVPQHRDALRVAVASYFNQMVVNGTGPGAESQWVEVSRTFLARGENDATDLQAIAIVAIWRTNQRLLAVQEWRKLGRSPSAIAARLLVTDRTVSPEELSAVPLAAWDEPLVRLASAQLRIAPPPGVRPADPRRAAEVLQRLFTPPSPTTNP